MSRPSASSGGAAAACPEVDAVTGEVDMEQAIAFLTSFDEEYGRLEERYSQLQRTRQVLKETSKALGDNVRELERDFEKVLSSKLVSARSRLKEAQDREQLRPPPVSGKAAPSAPSTKPKDLVIRPNETPLAVPTPRAPFLSAPAARFSRSADAQAKTIFLKAPPLHSCGGAYVRFPGHELNGYPIWRHINGVYYLFSCANQLVLVTDFSPGSSADYAGGLIASVYAHDGLMPTQLQDWQFNDGEAWIEDPQIGFKLTEESGEIPTTVDSDPLVVDDQVEDVASEAGYLSSESDESNMAGQLPTRSTTLYALPDPSTFLSKKKKKNLTTHF